MRRVSTDDQDLTLQIDSLVGLGVNRDDIFTDKISGAKTERPGLDACLARLQHGDTLVVWRLDRLGRSMNHLVELIEELRNRGIGFRSVSDGFIDTTSASGELIFHIFSALAQFERRLIQERTNAGLASARARGRLGHNAENLKKLFRRNVNLPHTGVGGLGAGSAVSRRSLRHSSVTA